MFVSVRMAAKGEPKIYRGMVTEYGFTLHELLRRKSVLE